MDVLDSLVEYRGLGALNGWKHGTQHKPRSLSLFTGNTPEQALQWMQRHSWYHTERTFHAKNYGGHGTAALSSRPDVIKAISLYLTLSNGIRSGKTWKKEFEGVIKSMLIHFRVDSDLNKVWSNLDDIHELTDKSDRQVSDQISVKKIIKKAETFFTGDDSLTEGDTQQGSPGIQFNQSPTPQNSGGGNFAQAGTGRNNTLTWVITGVGTLALVGLMVMGAKKKEEVFNKKSK